MQLVSLRLRISFCIEELSWELCLIPDIRISLMFCLGLAHLPTPTKYVFCNGLVANQAGGRPCRKRHLRPPDFVFSANSLSIVRDTMFHYFKSHLTSFTFMTWKVGIMMDAGKTRDPPPQHLKSAA